MATEVTANSFPASNPKPIINRIPGTVSSRNTLASAPEVVKAPAIQPNLKSEVDRLKTFETWPVAFMDRRILAAAGFIYTKRADTVRCVFCGVEIGKWEEGDDPFRDHQRWSPACAYMRRIPVGNIPLDPNNPSIVPLSDGHQNYDVCGPYGIQICPFAGLENGEVKSEDQTLEKLGIHRNRGPRYPRFNTLDARMKSYANWPLSIKQRPDKLSEAGFYYTGKGDQTVCFHCGGGLKDWEDTDDPWVEHALWFSKCTYMILNKGKEFIEKVCGEKKSLVAAKEARNLKVPSEFKDKLEIRDPVVPSTSSSEVPPPSIEESAKKGGDDGRLCKICFQEELGVVFLPCGHIVACVKCAVSLHACVVCRQPFTATVRAFLS